MATPRGASPLIGPVATADARMHLAGIALGWVSLQDAKRKTAMRVKLMAIRGEEEEVDRQE